MTRILPFRLASLSILALTAACGDEPGDNVEDFDTRPLEAGDTDEDFEDGLQGALGEEENPVLLDEEIAESDRMRLDPYLVTLTEVRVPSDVQAMVDNSFDRADVNDDGVLSGEEYLIVAPALGQSDNNIGDVPGDKPGGPAMGTGDTQGATGLPMGWEAASRETFIREVSGGDMAIDREEMFTSFMERYEQADADGNDVLEGDEIAAYGRLALAVQE